MSATHAGSRATPFLVLNMSEASSLEGGQCTPSDLMQIGFVVGTVPRKISFFE